MFQILAFAIVSIAFAQEQNRDGFIVKSDAESKAEAIRHFVPSAREGKNLVGVFPFNQEPSTHAHHGHHDGHEHHHEHEHEEHHDLHSVPAAVGFANAREARQRRRNQNRNNRRPQRPTSNPSSSSGDGGNPSFDEVAAAGERCIDKIEMTEVTEYDDSVTCKHSYSEQCHQSYVTDYKPAQKEECDEEFIKNCHIEYKKIAQQETVRKCHEPLICGGEGPEVCRTSHTTACETKLEVHEVDDDVVNCKTEFEESCEDVTQGYSTSRECKKWPKVKCDKRTVATKKATPITQCRSVPVQVCGPEGCILEKGEEVCFDEVQTVINPVRIFTNNSFLVPISIIKFSISCINLHVYFFLIFS